MITLRWVASTTVPLWIVKAVCGTFHATQPVMWVNWRESCGQRMIQVDY